MKKGSSIFLIFSVLVFESVGAARESLSIPHATTIDAACRQERDDRYDFGWRLTQRSKSFPGVCLNTKSLRSANILAESPTELHFANFYHKGKYWTADWNKNTNRPRVQLYIVHFDSGVPFVVAGHTELHFVFPHEIELTSQTTGERDKVKDVIVSWEAIRPLGVDYDVLTGLRDNFGIVGRVASLQARVPENILPDGSLRQTDVYDLQLTESEGAYLFLLSIGESSDLAFSQFYKTLGLNCTSELFDLVDRVFRVMDPSRVKNIRPFRTSLALDPIVGPSRDAMMNRGLVAPNSLPKDLATLLHLKRSAGSRQGRGL